MMWRKIKTHHSLEDGMRYCCGYLRIPGYYAKNDLKLVGEVTYYSFNEMDNVTWVGFDCVHGQDLWCDYGPLSEGKGKIYRTPTFARQVLKIWEEQVEDQFNPDHREDFSRRYDNLCSKYIPDPEEGFLENLLRTYPTATACTYSFFSSKELDDFYADNETIVLEVEEPNEEGRMKVLCRDLHVAEYLHRVYGFSHEYTF